MSNKATSQENESDEMIPRTPVLESDSHSPLEMIEHKAFNTLVSFEKKKPDAILDFLKNMPAIQAARELAIEKLTIKMNEELQSEPDEKNKTKIKIRYQKIIEKADKDVIDSLSSKSMLTSIKTLFKSKDEKQDRQREHRLKVATSEYQFLASDKFNPKENRVQRFYRRNKKQTASTIAIIGGCIVLPKLLLVAIPAAKIFLVVKAVQLGIKAVEAIKISYKGLSLITKVDELKDYSRRNDKATNLDDVLKTLSRADTSYSDIAKIFNIPEKDRIKFETDAAFEPFRAFKESLTKPNNDQDILNDPNIQRALESIRLLRPDKQTPGSPHLTRTEPVPASQAKPPSRGTSEKLAMNGAGPNSSDAKADPAQNQHGRRYSL